MKVSHTFSSLSRPCSSLMPFTKPISSKAIVNLSSSRRIESRGGWTARVETRRSTRESTRSRREVTARETGGRACNNQFLYHELGDSMSYHLAQHRGSLELQGSLGNREEGLQDRQRVPTHR